MESSFVEGRVLNAIGEFALEKPRSWWLSWKSNDRGFNMYEYMHYICAVHGKLDVYWYVYTYIIIYIYTYHIYIHTFCICKFVYIYVMLQSWSSTALEQNLCHLRNHWGIEDKTFPWRCFYTNLTDEICVSHDLFSIQTMKHAFGFLHTLFFHAELVLVTCPLLIQLQVLLKLLEYERFRFGFHVGARLAEFVIDLGESASSVDDFEAKLQELRTS